MNVISRIKPRDSESQTPSYREAEFHRLNYVFQKSATECRLSIPGAEQSWQESPRGPTVEEMKREEKCMIECVKEAKTLVEKLILPETYATSPVPEHIKWANSVRLLKKSQSAWGLRE